MDGGHSHSGSRNSGFFSFRLLLDLSWLPFFLFYKSILMLQILLSLKWRRRSRNGQSLLPKQYLTSVLVDSPLLLPPPSRIPQVLLLFLEFSFLIHFNNTFVWFVISLHSVSCFLGFIHFKIFNDVLLVNFFHLFIESYDRKMNEGSPPPLVVQS